ncbi:hypothetical protein [Aurantibacter sp.]|uniref:hypothetical protein n=1 Tax=Aurantibacter sp. TaxID=2807103 RepID=UPI003267D0D0
MSQVDKESLEKLLVFITEICEDENNGWFREKLISTVYKSSKGSKNIDSIYEYCVKEVIKDQALKFYKDFKLTEIKSKLIDDFIRMEQFKREDNFEDFCLAMFQQVENIVTHLYSKYNLNLKVTSDSNLYLISRYNSTQNKFIRDKRGLQIGHFIFQKYKERGPINVETQTWYYSNKFRAVLLYYYFNNKIEYDTKKFDAMYNIANELYQMRNLNHRGSELSSYQEKMVNKIIPNYNRYYFRFLGFLEDLITGINNNLPVQV